MKNKTKNKKPVSNKERLMRSLRSRDSDELIEMILDPAVAKRLRLNKSELHWIEDELATRDIYFSLDGRQLLDVEEFERQFAQRFKDI